MPFVSRDEDNRIIALYRKRSEQAPEELPANHPEVTAFLYSEVDSSPLPLDDLYDMRLSDLGMIRVIEDLIDVLIAKRVIAFTDLPPAAIKRLKTRKNIRQRLDKMGGILRD